MSVVLIILLCAAAGCLGVVAFEGLFRALRGVLTRHTTKAVIACVWWATLMLTGWWQGAQGVVQTLVLVPISLSHVSLARDTEEIIPLSEVLRNIPKAIRSAFGQIKPFLK